MKSAYPVILSQGEKFVIVDIPDFNISTQGLNYTDAIKMAQDAICLVGIDMQDDNQILPLPSPASAIRPTAPGDIVTLVDVDFAEYRRRQNIEKRFAEIDARQPEELTAEEVASLAAAEAMDDGSAVRLKDIPG